jgi:predicted RNase H-like HicB family nuclease
MTKDIHYYMALPYTIEIMQDDGIWFARVRELEGCMTFSEAEEQIFPMIREAMELWLETAIERNRPVPEPQAVPE